MRKDVFTPCDCKKCYFCKLGHTGAVRGVDKKKRKSVFHYQCGGRLVSEGCTDVRVNLDTSSQYCRMCYRLQNPALPSTERKANCRSSVMGCAQCKEPICKVCWTKGYDKRQKGDN